jgi:hypothetical protein
MDACLMTSVDDVVRMALEDLYPGHRIPDTDNYLPSGDQHKAPDHELMGGKVLIERKSRNTADNSQLYRKLQEIASAQGQSFFALGTVELGNVIRSLPDPDAATRKLTDYSMSQAFKRVREAKKKFEGYHSHVQNDVAVRIVIVSDNSDLLATNDADEYFFGRKMGGAGNKDETGVIDAIILIREPAYVLDRVNSYWFKCLIKGRLPLADRMIVESVSMSLWNRIAHYEPYVSALSKVKVGYYRSLVVSAETSPQ